MSSIDEIKKKLNIDEMDKEQRDKMFNKFIEKGGKVIEEKKVRTMRFNRETQKTINEKIKKKIDENKNKYARSYSTTQTTPSTSTTSSTNITQTNKIKHPVSIFIKGLLQGVFSLSTKFNSKFALLLKEDLYTNLQTLNFVCSQILNLEPEKKWQAVEFLNKSAPLSYELIMRVFNLYKVNAITRIQNYIKKYNNIICYEIIEDIKLLYKELVLLYPYWESIKETIWRSLLLYNNLMGKEPIISKSKINKFVDTIFNYYFPAFHIILTYNMGAKVEFDYNSMIEFISVKPEEDMGCYTKQLQEEKKRYLEQLEKEKEEMKKAFQDSIEKKELEKIPKYIQKGLLLIDSVIEKIPSKLQNDSKMQQFEPNEKMLHFYALFNEFDKEYSFLMTTSQVKLTPRLESGKRVDLKSDLDDCYIKFNEINNFIREYFELLDQYRSIDNDFKNNPLAMNQKKQMINIKRAQTYNEIKGRASVLFKKLEQIFQKIIMDYNGDKLILQNGDDILKFEHEYNSKRKFDGKKVIDAIAASFSFVAAFYYYINFDKLSQKGLYIESKENKKENEIDDKKQDTGENIEKKQETQQTQ